MSSFTSLGVPARLATVLSDLGITEPTPIQAATLPDALAGRDVLGRGRTGSGKTYAFCLPVVARLADTAPRSGPRPGKPRALILAPTRELAGQIHDSLAPLAKSAGLRTYAIFGGVGQNPQVNALRNGLDVLVACPGRLEDLMTQGHCRLDDVEITVLDEADHLADLGFLPAVRRLLAATPDRGQRLLFSATLDGGIDQLVKKFLRSPVTHQADSALSPVGTMTHHVLHIDREQRLPVLLDLTSAPGRTVVFTRTKHGARALARQLGRHGVPAVELHGNLAQNARLRNMEAFRSGQATTLVATDIAARGIHVDDVALVVHADPPAEHKAYLHRSGRTARAGNEGTVVTLMTGEQRADVRQLTRAAGIHPIITRVADPGHPLLAEIAPGERELRDEPFELAVATPQQQNRGGSSGGGGSRGGGRGRRGPARSAPSGAGQAAGRSQGKSRVQRSGQGPSQGDGAGAPRSSSPKRGGGPRRATAVAGTSAGGQARGGQRPGGQGGGATRSGGSRSGGGRRSAARAAGPAGQRRG